MYFSQLFYKNGDNETCAKIKKEYDLLDQIFFSKAAIGSRNFSKMEVPNQIN